MLAQNTGGKRTKTLPEFDLLIHLGLHSRTPGIAQNAAGPQGAGAKLHPPAEPPHHFLIAQKRRHSSREHFGCEPLVHRPLRLQVLLDLPIRERGPEIGSSHVILARRSRSSVSAVAMPDQLSHTQCTSGIARSRLDPEPPEGTFPKQA